MNQKHRTNLLALADLIESLPEEKVTMGKLESFKKQSPGALIKANEIQNNSDSTGSILNWGLDLAFNRDPTTLEDITDWGSMIEKLYGIPMQSLSVPGAWPRAFLFCPEWRNYNLTNKQHAARIRYYVKHGAPDCISYIKQLQAPYYNYQRAQEIVDTATIRELSSFQIGKCRRRLLQRRLFPVGESIPEDIVTAIVFL